MFAVLLYVLRRFHANGCDWDCDVAMGFFEVCQVEDEDEGGGEDEDACTLGRCGSLWDMPASPPASGPLGVWAPLVSGHSSAAVLGLRRRKAGHALLAPHCP